MNTKLLEGLRKLGIVFLFSLGVFILRALSAMTLAGPVGSLVTQQRWEGDALLRGILWIVISEFGQVIGTLGVGVYCIIGRFYRKPTTYGIIIVCLSFLFYFLSFQLIGKPCSLLGKFFALTQIIIFILSIIVLFIGNRLGIKLLARRNIDSNQISPV